MRCLYYSISPVLVLFIVVLQFDAVVTHLLASTTHEGARATFHLNGALWLLQTRIEQVGLRVSPEELARATLCTTQRTW